VLGIGPLRQWIIDHHTADDDTVFMVDDDVSGCWSIVGLQKHKLWRAADVLQVVANSAHCAREIGARIFGFSQSWDVRKFMPQRPVSFTGWVGGCVGIVGRERLYDPELKLRADIDACLTSLLRHRIIYRDDRFAFEHRRFIGAGGNAVLRSEAQHARELRYLRQKWGAHLTVQQSKTTTRLVVHAPRTQ
jgi:hypothetical protein